MRFRVHGLLFILPFLISIFETATGMAEEPQGSLADYASARAKVWLGCTFNNSLNRAAKCEPSTWYGRAVIDGMQNCRATVQSEACQNVVKAEPILVESLRRCDQQSVCTDHALSNFSLQACQEGFILGTGEAIEGIGDMFSNAASWTASGAKKFINRANERSEFLKKCVTKECKLSVIRDIPPGIGVTRFQELEPLVEKDHTKFPAHYLESERLKLVHLYSSYQRHSVVPRLLTDRAAEAETRNKGWNPPTPSESAIFEKAYALLQEKGVKLSCLDARTQALMMCWGAAYVIDPTIVATAALKGAHLSKTVYGVLERSSKTITFVRQFKQTVVPVKQLLGERISTLSIPGLPRTMNIHRFRNDLGEEIAVLERTVVGKDGKVYRQARELPIDPLTGTYDANFPTGREFLESMIKDLDGKATLVVVDIDNLGFVSKNFTHGFKGSPKEMRANSMKIGDKYIADVAKALKEVVGDAGQVWRTGGDEFGLVLQETDPEKVRAILDRISKRVRERDVRETFILESRARANQYDRAATGSAAAANAQAYRLGYAPYSQPNVSLGSVVVNGDDIPTAFARAEDQARAHKITTKDKFAADTTKYGGSAPASDALPQLTFVADASVPAQGSTTTIVSTGARTPSNARPLTFELPAVQETRMREVFRVDDVSVIEYQDSIGQTVLRSERWFQPQTGPRTFAAPELFLNAKTGFVDGRHPRTDGLMQTFAKSSRTPDRAAIWINTENLGIANNFKAGGMATGDQLLAETARVIRSLAGSSGSPHLPIKYKGSEFVVLTENMPVKKLEQFVSRLQAELSRDPAIRRIYDQQEAYLRSTLQEAERSVAAVAERQRQVRDAKASLDKFLKARESLFSVHGSPLSGVEEMSDVFERTRGLRYPD